VIGKYHVRHRVLDPDTGRWLTRDPAGYVDGMNLHEYARSAPMDLVDPMGLMTGLEGGGVYRPPLTISDGGAGPMYCAGMACGPDFDDMVQELIRESQRANRVPQPTRSRSIRGCRAWYKGCANICHTQLWKNFDIVDYGNCIGNCADSLSLCIKNAERFPEAPAGTDCDAVHRHLQNEPNCSSIPADDGVLECLLAAQCRHDKCVWNVTLNHLNWRCDNQGADWPARTSESISYNYLLGLCHTALAVDYLRCGP